MSSSYDVRMGEDGAIYSALAETGRTGSGVAASARPVTKVPFTVDDLALTRLSQAPAPLAESVFGFAQLRRRSQSAPAGRWVRHARRAFPATARPLLDLIPSSPPWPAFLDQVTADLDEGLELMHATPRHVLRADLAASWHGTGRPSSWVRDLADGEAEARETLRRALRDFHLACVAPYWSHILAVVRSDVAERIPVLATGGLAALFNALSDDLAWLDNSLVRSWRTSRTCDLSLDGRGLQIVPSALWVGPPLFCLHPEGFGGNALVYPVRSATTTNGSGETSGLAGLLGRTRAATLQALRSAPHSTLELAAVIGTSAPSASEHAKALRMAGLVQTTRQGRAVRHSLTPLGRSLLDG
jgi:DNA-binding transcriptional ArsR family regulator